MSGDSAAGRGGPVKLAALLVELLRGQAGRKTHLWQEERQARKRLTAYVLAGVGDERMQRSIAWRAASAVVDHGLGRDELEAIVEATRRKRAEGTIRTSPGAYFLFRIRKECRLQGIRLFESKKNPYMASCPDRQRRPR